jgi:hypothetical protein
MVDYGWGPVTNNPAPYPVTKQRTEGATTVAFVLSLLGLFTWGLSCITALFLAPRAKRNVDVDPMNRKGKGLAMAAQIISGCSLGITAVVLLLIFLT